MAALSLPFLVFIALPPLALLPGLAFWLVWRRRRQRIRRPFWIFAAVGAWALYAVYESGVWLWSRDVVAPIRVDLLVIAPLLYGLSLAAVAVLWRARTQAAA